MKNFIRVFLLLALGTVVAFSIGGCCEDEPVIIVPEAAPAPPVLRGTVITNDGRALEGAVITVTGEGKSYTVTTGADGKYSIEVEPGSYKISASKDDYSGRDGEVIAENNAVTIWNAMLRLPIVTSGGVNAGEDTYIEIPIPPLVEEASAGDEAITAYIYCETTEEDDELIMKFYYDAVFLEDTKAAESHLMRLINVQYYLLSGNELNKPIIITVSTPVEPAFVKLNDRDIEYEFSAADGEVRIETQELGWLTFDYYVDIWERKYGKEPVDFEQETYDNFYGAGPMYIQNPKYTYHTGGFLTGNHVLLNALAAVYTGTIPKTAETAEYPLDLTLPVGGKMLISGSQDLRATEFDVADGLMHSTVVEYLGPVIDVETINRQHNGGSN